MLSKNKAIPGREGETLQQFSNGHQFNCSPLFSEHEACLSCSAPPKVLHILRGAHEGVQMQGLRVLQHGSVDNAMGALCRF